MPASLVSVTDHQPRELHTVSYWRRRTLKAENLLCALLGSGTKLTDDQRARMLGTLHGHTGQRLKNEHGLSDCEQEIVDHYRATDQKGREMLRTLLARLAATREASALKGRESND